MNCPRCDSSTLREFDRDGVTIDQCPACRGVWLDRGELEKLVNRAISEIHDAESRSAGGSAAYEMPRERRDERSGRDDDDRGRDRHHDRDHDRHHPHHKKKKRSWFESIEDLFGG